ncbi:hypothetical protein [Nocardioides speluncae]|uniref:hypothetical protein n=1 Tax=Nocardioides speluncae TaxID=2670337 RepID=UPI000D698F3C|nr:hypothetical protein [Nocardioides speluncae]
MATLTVVAAAAVACGKPVTTTELDDAVGSLSGVTSTSVSCQEPLPRSYDCRGAVEMEPETLTEDQILAVKAATSDLVNDRDLSVTISAGESFALTYAKSAAVDKGLASVLVYAATTDGVTGLALAADSRTGDLQLENAPYSEVVGHVDEVMSRAEIKELAAHTEELVVNTGTGGASAGDEIALGERLDEEYGVTGGALAADRLELQLAEGTDVDEAETFAGEQPEFDKIAVVDLGGAQDDVSLSGASSEAAPRMKRIVDVARERPGFESASANGETLNVVMATLDDVDALHDALTAEAADDYEATGVSYATPDAVVARGPGEELHTEVARDLVGQDRWELIGVRADGFGTVLKVSPAPGPVDLRELGAALAETALAEEPMRVELSWIGDDDRRNEASFGSGSAEIEPELFGENKDDADALRDGWAEGFER